MKLNIENYSLSQIETVLKILFGEDWKNAEIEKEAKKFGIDENSFYITNYDQLKNVDVSKFGGEYEITRR